MEAVTIFWFRRDLRLDDNRGLFEALKASSRVLPLFVFDDDIIGSLPADDHRVSFIYDSVANIHDQLQKQGRGVLIRKGRPYEIFLQIINDFPVEAVYCNGDHEPYGQRRDEQIKALLNANGISFHCYIDHLVMNKHEVLKPDGSPYFVYTPYSKQWKANLNDAHLTYYESRSHLHHLLQQQAFHFPKLEELDFKRSSMVIPAMDTSQEVIVSYKENRDIPSISGTTRTGLYLRFGTISIRELVRKALNWNETYLNELIWREFFAMILWHYPKVVSQSFREEYDRIQWRNDEKEFEFWKIGATGFPMIDAGMRQLNKTGYMHNRLRMITASFLSKHLLIDWRWGEAYFAEKLFDYELSSNNGGWQWSAGTGCDAAPYFRIFNPITQQTKFDPELKYVRAWVPELDKEDYPKPMVDLQLARERCLHAYKAAVGEK